MNLLCPNCQKMLQVPEQYAGQQMKCPLCAGEFTVPALPQVAAPAMAPRGPAPGFAAPPPVKESPPPRGGAALPNHSETDDGPSPAADRAPPPPPPEGYAHARVLTLNQRLIPFLAPAALGLIFLLTFFPWIGLYPGGVNAGTQSAWAPPSAASTPTRSGCSPSGKPAAPT